MNKDNSSPEPELIDLYQKPEKIYTRSFKGQYRNLRIAGGSLLFLLFFGTAWINWGGQQIVLFDLPERKFHLFGTTFWPQDFILLSWLLIICAFGLFTITVFAGRIWCGYTCPQSVFTWVFMWAEKITEGDRNRRMKLDKQPMTPDKFLRKLAKHGIWLSVAFLTGLTFVGYFTPIRELIPDILAGEVNPWGTFWIAFFALATYGNAGWLREQVCVHMCPYARFQSVMFDNDTLVVAYDKQRGESRGPRKRSIDHKAEGLGDCIDCKVCVHVCPTGIDIRDGLQIQCIGCAACVDACDDIMGRMGYDKGLVSYTTDNQLAGQSLHWFRPRLAGYATALLVMIGMFLWTLGNRTTLELEVLRDRNVLYRTTATDQIENIYTLKIANKDRQDHQVRVQVNGIEGLSTNSNMTFVVQSGEVAQQVIRLLAPQATGGTRNREIEFTVSTDVVDMPPVSTSSRFLYPDSHEREILPTPRH
ncbi:MAG: cytochrome c oxidase accessory protein CcoG [Endozoicomonas sp.]